jgi:membrane fusion protein (multidrug efflux system)
MNPAALLQHNSIRTFVFFPLALLIACGNSKPPAAGPGAPPSAEVAVVTIAPKALTLTTELPGRLEPYRVAQVRAQVAGIVLKRVFTEGSEVKAGQSLFRIDAAPYQANADSAQAQVAKNRALLAKASVKVQRYAPLVRQNAISREEYDDALTTQKQGVADLEAAIAASKSAQLNLGHANVTAPIAGRIGRALVTEGALVGQGEATQMAVIQQLNPIYVTLSQSSGEVLRLRRALASGQLKSILPGNGKGGEKTQAKVTLITEDGQTYPQTGKLLFSDLAVDESTGAISLRAEFPNPERLLLPGMYVRARLEQAVSENTITVPQQAVQRGTEGAQVLVVGADNKVAVRPVSADRAQGNDWIISQGLQAGERVIVEGFQKAKPGSTVKPVPWQGPVGSPAASSTPR